MKRSVGLIVRISLLIFFLVLQNDACQHEMVVEKVLLVSADQLLRSNKNSIKTVINKSESFMSNSAQFCLDHYKMIGASLVCTSCVLYLSQQMINSWNLKKMKKSAKEIKQETKEVDAYQRQEKASIKKSLQEECAEIKKNKKTFSSFFNYLCNFFCTHKEANDKILKNIERNHKDIGEVHESYNSLFQQTLKERQESVRSAYDEALGNLNNLDMSITNLENASAEQNNQIREALTNLEYQLNTRVINPEES